MSRRACPRSGRRKLSGWSQLPLAKSGVLACSRLPLQSAGRTLGRRLLALLAVLLRFAPFRLLLHCIESTIRILQELLNGTAGSRESRETNAQTQPRNFLFGFEPVANAVGNLLRCNFAGF